MRIPQGPIPVRHACLPLMTSLLLACTAAEPGQARTGMAAPMPTTTPPAPPTPETPGAGADSVFGPELLCPRCVPGAAGGETTDFGRPADVPSQSYPCPREQAAVTPDLLAELDHQALRDRVARLDLEGKWYRVSNVHQDRLIYTAPLAEQNKVTVEVEFGASRAVRFQKSEHCDESIELQTQATVRVDVADGALRATAEGFLYADDRGSFASIDAKVDLALVEGSLSLGINRARPATGYLHIQLYLEDPVAVSGMLEPQFVYLDDGGSLGPESVDDEFVPTPAHHRLDFETGPSDPTRPRRGDLCGEASDPALVPGKRSPLALMEEAWEERIGGDLRTLPATWHDGTQTMVTISLPDAAGSSLCARGDAAGFVSLFGWPAAQLVTSDGRMDLSLDRVELAIDAETGEPAMLGLDGLVDVQTGTDLLEAGVSLDVDPARLVDAQVAITYFLKEPLAGAVTGEIWLLDSTNGKSLADLCWQANGEDIFGSCPSPDHP